MPGKVFYQMISLKDVARLDFDKYTGGNFAAWKASLELIFEALGVSDFFDLTTTPTVNVVKTVATVPASSSSSSSTLKVKRNLTDESEARSEDDQKTSRVRFSNISSTTFEVLGDAQAQDEILEISTSTNATLIHLIGSTLDPRYKSIIRGIRHARDAYVTLVKTLKPTGAGALLSIRASWKSEKYKYGSSVLDYFNKLADYREAYVSAGGEDAGNLSFTQDVVSGLSTATDYSDLLKHISYQPTLPSPQELCALLLNEEAKVSLTKRKLPTATVAAIESSRPKSGGFKGRCFNCQQFGNHLARDCTNPRRERDQDEKEDPNRKQNRKKKHVVEKSASPPTHDSERARKMSRAKNTVAAILSSVIAAHGETGGAPNCNKGQTAFMIDSGSPFHIIGEDQAYLLRNLVPCSEADALNSIAIGGSKLVVKMIGELVVETQDEIRTLRNVHVIQGNSVAVYSTENLQAAGETTIELLPTGMRFSGGLNEQAEYFNHKNWFIWTTSPEDAHLDKPPPPPEELRSTLIMPIISESKMISVNQLHRRMCHASTSILKPMIDNSSEYGLVVSGKDPDQCEACVLSKITAKPHQTHESLTPPSRPFQRVGIDLSGKREASEGGANYLLTIIDHFSKWAEVYPLKRKDHTFQTFIEYSKRKSKEFGTKLEVLLLHDSKDEETEDTVICDVRLDNGELASREMKDWAVSTGVQLQYTTPYSPEQNAIVERNHRTLDGSVRASLTQKKLELNLWAEASLFLNSIRNRMPCKALGNKSPFEVVYGKIPCMSAVHEFGSAVVVKRPKRKGKIANPGERGILLNMNFDRNSFKIRLTSGPRSGKVVESRDVVFLEEKIVLAADVADVASENKRKNPSSEQSIPIPELVQLDQLAEKHRTMAEQKHEGRDQSNDQLNQLLESTETKGRSPGLQPVSPVPPERDNSPDTPPNALQSPDMPHALPVFPAEQEAQIMQPEAAKPPEGSSRPERMRTLSKKAVDSFQVYAVSQETPPPRKPVLVSESTVNITVKEALANPKWSEAMSAEIASHMHFSSYSIVKRPSDANVIGTKWIFSLKRIGDDVFKYKARLVLQGYQQIDGMDYDSDDVYAPTASSSAIRFFFSTSVALGLPIVQTDFSTAFLQAQLTGVAKGVKVYIQLPQGFDESGSVGELHRPIYGSHQGSSDWSKEYSAAMIKRGYSQSTVEPTIFWKKTGKSITSLVISFVDDSLTADKDPSIVIKSLQSDYKLRELGIPRKYVGLNIAKTETGYHISMEDAIDTAVVRFGLSDARGISTPIDKHLQPREPKEEKANRHLYLSIIGTINYIANAGRPDIAYAAHQLSRYCVDPSYAHLQAARRVVQYLKCTAKLGVSIDATADSKLVSYADADFAADSDRVSVTGAVQYHGGNLISWRSVKQKAVSTSTCESELNALRGTALLNISTRALMEELGQDVSSPSTCFVDNMATIAVVRGTKHSTSLKHVSVSIAKAREEVSNGSLSVKYIPSVDNIADICTKPLARVRFEYLRSYLLA